MYKSKVFHSIELFSDYEQQLLLHYVQDPNFNKHSKVTELYKYIYKYKSNKNALDKNNVFKNLFPGEKYNDLKLRHLMSYLLKVVEAFGYLQTEQNNKYESSYQQLQFYSYKEFSKGIEESHHSFISKLKKNDILTTKEIYTTYNTYTLLYNYSVRTNRTEINLLQNLNTSLDAFFILSKLKVACSIVNQQQLFNQTIQSGFFKDLLEYTSNSYLQYPMINLYYHIYQMIQNNNSQLYEVAYDAFKKCLNIENKSEIRDALMLLINFCIRQINMGNHVYEDTLFEHYKIGIEKGILLDKGKLSPFSYSNTINLAIKQNKIVWAEEFMESYKNALDSDKQGDYYALNKSKCLVAKNQYSEALDFINQTHIEDLLTQLQIRVIQLKIFIELDEYNLTESYIKNFKQLLKRKSIISYHKTNFNNIAKYMNKLLYLAPYATKAKEKLLHDIQAEKILSEKAWLIEKLSLHTHRK